ncbi:plexin-A4-like isoform X2 [Oscarella lobularis]|uniref:plexin-A4-like isoform X2 n=1 Tax=Oscarella lobularis TaxID=121494 RepID=UPI003313C6CB
MSGSTLCLGLLTGWIVLTCASSDDANSIWQAPQENVLRTAIVNHFNGNVYVGAKNAVFQLDQNLNLLNTLTTGPLRDAADCFPPSWNLKCFGSKMTTPMLADNYVQIISSTSFSRLLLCGNLRAGSCDLHALHNVSLVVLNSSQLLDQARNQSQPVIDMLVASRDAEANTATVNAPDYRGRPSLYVASYSQRRTGNYQPPTLSVRQLTRGSELAVTSKLELQMWDKRTADARARYGFTSGEFVYFASYQQGNTVLSRICTNDRGMDTGTLKGYMEGSIQCRGSKEYKFMTSQMISKPSADLASWLNVNVTDDIIVATFASDFEATAEKPTGNSAVCLFPANVLEREFKAKQQECIQGKGIKGIRREGKTIPCVDASQFWNDNACSSELFSLTLELDTPITVSPIYETNDTVLSATALLTNDATTALYVGTSKGKVLKLTINFDQEHTSNTAVKVTTEGVDLKEEIIQAHTSANRRHVYFMSSSKVAKIPAVQPDADDGCALHSGCQSCVHSGSCGYCILESACSKRRENCLSAGSKYWVQNELECPKFEWFSPLNASYKNQMTKVTMSVANVPIVPDGSIVCAFGEHAETVASFEGRTQTFVCDLPRVRSLNKTTGTISVQVYLKFVPTNAVIARSQQRFSFYDCTILKDCETCVRSDMHCQWCSNTGQCLNHAQQGCNARNTCSGGDGATEPPSSWPATPTVPIDPSLTDSPENSILVIALSAGMAVLCGALIIVTALLIGSRRHREGHYSVNPGSTLTSTSRSRSSRNDADATSSAFGLQGSIGSSRLEVFDEVPELPTFGGRRNAQVVSPKISVTSDGYQRPIDVINQLRVKEKQSVVEDGYDKLRFTMTNL